MNNLPRLINLTPHTINLVCESASTSIEPSGNIARISTKDEVVDKINGFPITKTVFGDVENLPKPEENVFFIVSALVAAKVKRSDVLSPGRLVRNKNGQVIGCESLVSHVE